MGAKTERTPVTPSVLEDPMLNRPDNLIQAVQDAMWQPGYPGQVS
jgi:hypothetical protein